MNPIEAEVVLHDAPSGAPEPATATLPVPAMPGGVGGPLGPSSALLTNPQALQVRLDAYSCARKIFLHWLHANLVPGVDYMVIHRRLKTNRKTAQGKWIWDDCPNEKAPQTAKPCAACKAKPTLLKPGGEKICGLLRLTRVYHRDVEVWEMLGKVDGLVALRCELISDDGQGHCVAEGRGARFLSQDSTGYADERTADPNKTVKMVEKSSALDAVLQHAGLSEIFTLDLEDMKHLGGNGGGREPGSDDGDAPAARPIRKSAQATAATPPPADLATKLRGSVQAVCGTHASPLAFKPIPEEKRRALFGEIRECVAQHFGDAPVSKAERAEAEAAVHAALKAHMTAEWGITSTKEIPLGLYDAAIGWVRQHVGGG